MLISIFLVITINFYIYYKLELVLTTNFLYDLVIVSISQTYRLSWYGFFACVLLHILLDIAWKYVTSLTSSCGWSIVRVGTVVTWCLGCWFQYHWVSNSIKQIYCAKTTNFPGVIIFPLIVVLSCSVYAPDVNMIT